MYKKRNTIALRVKKQWWALQLDETTLIILWMAREK